MSERDPGVPGALGEALRRLTDRMPPERVDRLWIFPPIRKGRRESGLLAASCFAGSDRRLLVTLAYRAEETGSGIAFDASFQEEGEAPDDRLPRVIEGVIQRSGEQLGEPRSVDLGGVPEALEDLLSGIDPGQEASLPGGPPRTFGAAEEAST
jgi:hypothetical protein